jgi:membrane dipeptidase
MLSFRDYRSDPESWARELGVPTEAVALYLASDVIDLHVDSFIWYRVFGYDLRQRHGGPAGARRGALRRSLWGHVDFPRVLEAQLSGAVWIVTTNPWRSAAGRTRTLLRNLDALRGLVASVADQLALVCSAAEYRQARAQGKHAAFVGIQGGNALDAGPEAIELLPERLVLLVTLVHLTSSRLGRTSSPLGVGGADGLSARGQELVRRLDSARIFVDLAHGSRRTFFDAVAAHDRSLPLLVSHTGVCGVTPHWRNLDDEQLRAVADTGGVVGVIYQAEFLGDPWAHGRAGSIVAHLAHIVDTIGEDHAALGSDWDGAITTPEDMPSCLELPRLVALMLERGWSPGRVQKILGGNALRAIAALRG